VLVRVLAVALNPTDHKMAQHFPTPQSTMGCDFCGIIVAKYAGPLPDATLEDGLHLGARVCGAVWAYNPADKMTGAFAEYLSVDRRLLLKVPDAWSNLEAASVGGIGWTTVGLAFWGPDGLQLRGRPSSPLSAVDKVPVLVYGGGTVTGRLACQMLRL
jgi:NADPH:quinone reductase-like Zn-dependent oxidoreductase